MVDQSIKLKSEDSYELDDVYDLVTAGLSLNWKGHQGPEVGLLFHLGVWCGLCGLCGLCGAVWWAMAHEDGIFECIVLRMYIRIIFFPLSLVQINNRLLIDRQRRTDERTRPLSFYHTDT